jgi:hypothetical protein
MAGRGWVAFPIEALLVSGRNAFVKVGRHVRITPVDDLDAFVDAGRVDAIHRAAG